MTMAGSQRGCCGYPTRRLREDRDRIKDMIIVSGFNVYPNELEDVCARHRVFSSARLWVLHQSHG